MTTRTITGELAMSTRSFEGALERPRLGSKQLWAGRILSGLSIAFLVMDAGMKLANLQMVKEGASVRDEVLQGMQAEVEMASRNAITTKGFEQEARRIAKLMAERFDLGFVDVGGWDTHVNEGGATGYLAGRFEELGRGLAAFADEMGPAWRDTVVVVVSEFGRTFRENGNRGTDHGHGTVYWVLGGNIHGGQVLGEQVRVERATLNQDRDYPVLNEYRGVIGGIASRLFSLPPARMAAVFPGSAPRDLGIA